MHAIFQNGGFESGNFTSWTQTSARNNGLTGTAPFTTANLNFSPGGSFRGFIRGVGFKDPRAPTSRCRAQARSPRR